VAISRWDASETRSSASSARIQSPLQASSARFFCGPKPGQSGASITRAPRPRAIAAVSSLLPWSTTTISSAQATLRRQSAMLICSLRVISATETRGFIRLD
jgi:hypothetical protein